MVNHVRTRVTICSNPECQKEIKDPLLFTIQEENYYACPHCLTKITSIPQESNDTQVSPNETSVSKNNKTEEKRIAPPIDASPQRVLDRHIVPQAVTIQKLESLEKEKTDLLVELDKLRAGAIQKVSNLEEELVMLREETEILKKMMV